MESQGPPISLARVNGPINVGFYFNLLLAGILIVQVYLYYLNFPKDRAGIKALVYLVFLLELTQTVILAEFQFETYGAAFTTPESINAMRTSWFSVPIMTAINGAIVQSFFGYRVLVVSTSWIPACVVWIMALLACGSGIAQGVLSKPLMLSEVFANTKTTLSIWLISSAVNDVLIAVVLSYFLWNMRTGFKKTDVLLTRLIRSVIETGTLTAILAVLTVILFFAYPEPWYIMLTEVIAKVYSNSMMVSLNRRAADRGDDAQVVSSAGFTGHSTPGVALHSTTRQGTDTINISKTTEAWTDDEPFKAAHYSHV